jgi:hypothetical protein
VSVSRHRTERTHVAGKALIERQMLSSRSQLGCVQRMPKNLNAGNFICWTADVVLIGGGHNWALIFGFCSALKAVSGLRSRGCARATLGKTFALIGRAGPVV